jgi:hypothetical protein
MAKWVGSAIVIVRAQAPSPFPQQLHSHSKAANEAINGSLSPDRGRRQGPDWQSSRRPDHAKALIAARKLCWSNIDFQEVFIYVNTRNMAKTYDA